MKPTEKPEIHLEDCTGCAECLTVCEVEALTLVDNTVAISPDIECDYCAECEEVCPTGAITCPYEVVIVEDGN